MTIRERERECVCIYIYITVESLGGYDISCFMTLQTSGENIFIKPRSLTKQQIYSYISQQSVTDYYRWDMIRRTLWSTGLHSLFSFIWEVLCTILVLNVLYSDILCGLP